MLDLRLEEMLERSLVFWLENKLDLRLEPEWEQRLDSMSVTEWERD